MAKINNILNKVSNVGNIVNSTINKVGGLFTSDDYTPASIRDKYTNGFFGDTTHFVPNVFARFFDEPTYLTFRIKFDTSYNFRNNANSGEALYYSLDYLPEALLSKPEDTDTNKNSTYSAYYYLRDTLGETKRAAMLKQLIAEINDIQNNYPYYFTEISGLGNLGKIDTGGGVRLKDDAVIEIKCYDAIDMKITQWMQMYRKIAWDDVYQRWILPDIMRFFSMKIYVSEMRLFHDMSKSISSPKRGRLYEFTGNNGGGANATSYDQLGNSGIFDSLGKILNKASAISSRVLGTESTTSKILNTTNQIGDTVTGLISGLSNSIVRLCNNAINDFMPTICYDCHMCQFLIDDTLSTMDTMKSYKPETYSTKIKISIGQVFETQSYPLNTGLGISGNKYAVNTDSPYSASYYIDDEMLRCEATHLRESISKTSDESTFANGINRTHNRINDKLSYTDNTEDSYQIFNSNAAISANALITSICNKFENSDVLSTATNTSSEEMKSVLKQVSQSTEETGRNKRTSTSVNSTTQMKTVDANHAIISTATNDTTGMSKEILDEIDSDIKSAATDDALTETARRQIKDLYSKYSLSEISTATAVLTEIGNTIRDNKQINDMSQIEIISEQMKNNMMKSVLTEIAANTDDAANGALVKLAQIVLDDSAEFSTATSDESKEKLTGFSLLN